MTIDLAATSAFLTSHARTLDRRRFAVLTGTDEPAGALAALDAYRNPDGGYGWGLEPDLRSVTSQPAAALHALEVFAEVGPTISPHAARLCDWLATVTLPEGALPFALPVTDPHGCAPFWASADPTEPSLQISAIVAAHAHRVAAHDPEVAAHPWLATVTDYCLAAIDALRERPHALVLVHAVRFLDAASRTRPEAAELLDRLRAHVPDDGVLHVAGGAEDESMRALDFAPWPDTPARRLFAPEVIDAELRRLVRQQQDDGGWRVDFDSYSPAAAMEWRGYATVRAVALLRSNGLS